MSASVFIRMWSRKLIAVGPLKPADKDEILIDPMKLLETAMADKDWLYQKAKAVIT
jgi:hypothetical protein